MAVDSSPVFWKMILSLVETRLESAATWMRKALQTARGEIGGDT